MNILMLMFQLKIFFLLYPSRILLAPVEGFMYVFKKGSVLVKVLQTPHPPKMYITLIPII